MINNNKLKNILQLVRAPNGITAVSNILAATFIATGIASSSTPAVTELMLLCIASLCLYYAGMALNDCCDYQEDLAERAQRPLPSGAISIRTGWLLTIVLFILGLGAALAVSQQSFFVAVLLTALIITYDVFIKNGLLGAFAMGSCRYANWLLGLSIVSLTLPMLILPLPIFFYIAGLTYLSKQETRAENPRALYVVSILLVCSLLSLLALVKILFGFTPVTSVIIFAWIALIVYRLTRTLKHFNPQEIQTTVMWMIIGIIPFDALMSALAGNHVAAIFIFLLFFPCRYLSKKLYMT